MAIFFLDTIRRATEEGPRLTIAAPRAAGLAPGSAVWVAGRPVGRVLSVHFRPPGGSGDPVIIRAVLRNDVDRVIRADAFAAVQPSDLLGPVVVAIAPGTRTQPMFDRRDTLRAVEHELDPRKLQELADSLLAVAGRLGAEADDLEALLAESGTFNRMRGDPESVQRLTANLSDLRAFLDTRLPESTIGKMRTDSTLAPLIDQLKGRLVTLDSLAGSRKGLDEARAAADALAERAARLSASLDAGEGTAGRALHDREFLRQLALLRARIDSAWIELYNDPRRWLRVRLF